MWTHISDVARAPGNRTSGGSVSRPLALTKVRAEGVSTKRLWNGTGQALAFSA